MLVAMYEVWAFEIEGRRWPIVWDGPSPPRDSARCRWTFIAAVRTRPQADRLLARLHAQARAPARLSGAAV